MGKRRPASTLRVLLAFWALVAVVAAQNPKGAEDFSFSFLGTSSDPCANVDCMKGTCVPNENALVSILFPYTCKCDLGWATVQNVIPLLEIPSLPCNVPNCSLNLACEGNSPPPASSPSAPIASANTSACLVPGICGNGNCVVTTQQDSLVPTFKCVCNPGYENVLNLTAGYCVNHCEINGECRNLNITIPSLSSPPPPSPTTPGDQTANAGRTISPEPSPSGTSESVPGGSSSSTSAGCGGKSPGSGFYMAGGLVMGCLSLSALY